MQHAKGCLIQVRKNQKPNACGGEEGEVEAPSPASPSPGPGPADPVVNFLQTQSVYLGRHFLRGFLGETLRFRSPPGIFKETHG